jgi:hypothetical protein
MEAHERCEVTAARRHWLSDPTQNLPAHFAAQQPPIETLLFCIELTSVKPKLDYGTIPASEGDK